MSPGLTSRVASALSKAPRASCVSMRLDRFHPTHLREYASSTAARYTKLLSKRIYVISATHSTSGASTLRDIGHPQHIWRIHLQAFHQIRIHLKGMVRVCCRHKLSLQVTEPRFFAHDAKHALMVHAPASPH